MTKTVINMVDSNLQRQQITFSEKAFAYKMKNEAMKRTGGRRKSSQSDYPLKGKKTVEIHWVKNLVDSDKTGTAVSEVDGSYS